MPQHTLVIINRLGLHARAAAKFSTTAAQFNCQIQVHCHGKTVNGKSIMGLMMLAAAKGTEIQLVTEGEDAEAAIAALTQLIEQRFGEAE
ncbi:HPr family phosphocarrier protein [Halothiobacillus sp. DCM-1]|uniref:HPr family phosphocarrier protein n=1 Tax=Halothiobacillus sp. DCM-1 TaxID=3112558 RepID=UPI00324F78EB